MDESTESVSFSDKQDATLKRGKLSWEYIYIALGIILSIEGTVIQMIEPLEFPDNIILYVLVAVLTWYFFTKNSKFQGWLLSRKEKYENKPR